jgi:hypothetical protein
MMPICSWIKLGIFLCCVMYVAGPVVVYNKQTRNKEIGFDLLQVALLAGYFNNNGTCSIAGCGLPRSTHPHTLGGSYWNRGTTEKAETVVPSRCTRLLVLLPAVHMSGAWTVVTVRTIVMYTRYTCTCACTVATVIESPIATSTVSWRSCTFVSLLWSQVKKQSAVAI